MGKFKQSPEDKLMKAIFGTNQKETDAKEVRQRERLILDNRSSKPLYESYQKAFDFYFEEWSEEYKSQAMTWGDFKFYMITNKDSITIQIYDIDA